MTEATSVEFAAATEPNVREMVAVYIYGKYNGSGQLRRKDDGTVRLVGYNGVFPSIHSGDTDSMIYVIEDAIQDGCSNGMFEQRKRSIRWNLALRKDDY